MDRHRRVLAWTLTLVVGAASALAQGSAASTGAAAPTTQATQPTTQPVAPLATQPALSAAGRAELTEQAVQGWIKEAEGKTDLEPAVRETVVGLYNQALADLKRAAERAARTAEYEKAAAEAPAQTQRLREAATQPASRPDQEIPPDITTDEMAGRLRKLELELADLKKNADALDDALKGRAARQTELPTSIATAKEELSAIREKLEALRGSAEPIDVRRARGVQLIARRRALEERIGAMEKELATFETRGALLRAQRDYYARAIPQLQAAMTAWQTALARRRDEEARRQLEEARRKQSEAVGKHPLVRETADYNTQLTSLRTGPEGLIERRKRTAASQEAVQASLKRVESAFAKARRMVSEVAVTDVIGLFLRTQREQLPDVQAIRRRGEAREAEMSRLRLQQMQLVEKAAELSDVEARARHLVETAEPPVPEGYRQDVLTAVREGPLDQRRYLESLIRDEEEYFNELVKLDTDEKQLIRQTEAFRQYIDSRVLWIRSTAPLGRGDLVSAGDAVRWLVGGSNWRDLARDAWANLARGPVRWAMGLAVLLALLAVRRRLGVVLAAIGQAVAVRYPGKLGQTLGALGLTVLRAGTFPGALWLVGSLLAAGGDNASFAFAIGRGLMAAAAVWLPGELLRETLRQRGLAVNHFQWSVVTSRLLRRAVGRMLSAGLPLLFLVATLEARGVAAHTDSLGRLAAVAGLLLLGGYAAVTMWPAGPLMRGARPGGLLYRFRLALYAVVVLAPLWLAGTAAMGYYYTALQLSERLLTQFWVVIGLAVLHALLVRWLLIAHMALARRQVKRDSLASAPSRSGPAKPPPADAREDPAVRAAQVNAQTRQLLRYVMAVLVVLGFWLTWADVLPALGMLREIRLWSVASPAGARPVTLADLGLAVGVVILAVVAGKNIPGVLELTVLHRLRVEPGSRYAVNALARYLVGAVGTVLAASAVGIQWSHVQWLVAAMSLGLAFGLQEIFANFISGLILLFERPIRVGDVVTVGGVTGTVTRIRMRATTIADWDRKELLVPNKEFITTQVVNWTLSDTVTRIVIPVGIAYGSDAESATRLLLEAARGNPSVLPEPPPQAWFLGFGESALNFELRVHVGDLSAVLPVRHALHLAIDKAFRQAGIEIAFPQRDIHIRSIQGTLPISRAGTEPPKREC